MKNIHCLVALCSMFVFILTASLSMAAVKGTVTVFHAGSLSVPMAAMEKAFEAKYPEVDVQRESSGSLKAARKISELGKPCDIMAAADYRLIDKLLIPNFTNININFASNRMALCYTNKSCYAGSINESNWMDILQKDDVVWGQADPNLDPCGYRTLMVLQLAEKYYQDPGLYKKIVHARPESNIRPKAVELISLLHTGNMDYIWEYRSVAVQHHLKFIELPDQINLGNYKFDNDYSGASVVVSGKHPGTTMTMKGKSITYGVTLLGNAPNRDAAVAFLQFMLDPDAGLKILKEMGQPPFVPAIVTSESMKAALPAQIQSLVAVKK